MRAKNPTIKWQFSLPQKEMLAIKRRAEELDKPIAHYLRDLVIKDLAIVNKQETIK